MSTATIARDEYANPYSPRKQGAGLADIAKAIKTQAYLYQPGIDKAKIEVGDDPEKTGEYTLTFHARNLSDRERTYALGTQTMTETLASDGLTVAERSYMLNNMTEVSFSAKGGWQHAYARSACRCKDHLHGQAERCGEKLYQ